MPRKQQHGHRMDIVEDFPPPPPEMLVDDVPYADEEEGEQFEFDDSGDEVPEADRPPPAPLAPDYGAQANSVAPHPEPEGADPEPHLEGQPSNPDPPTATATVDTTTATVAASVPATVTTTDTAAVAAAEGEKALAVPVPADTDSDLPPPPSSEDSSPVGTDSDKEVSSDDPPPANPRTTSQKKVDPYSVIDITPVQLQQLEQQHGLSPSSSSPVERVGGEGEGQDVSPTSPPCVPPGYSVPVPCGYATPSGVPLITPAYTTPIIIRHFSVDEDGKGRTQPEWKPVEGFEQTFLFYSFYSVLHSCRKLQNIMM